MLIFSETTMQIGANLNRNVNWIVSYKVYVILTEVHKINKNPKGVKRMCPYMGMHFIVQLFFSWGFLNDFLQKIPFRNMHNIIM